MYDWQMIGSLADWTTAGVALLAFIVAALAARATLLTNRAQQETLDLQRRQYEEFQAGQVAFWINNSFDEITIINVSRLPIYSVMLFMYRWPSEPEVPSHVLWRERVLLNDTTSPFKVDPSDLAVWRRNSQKFSFADLYFRDSLGRHWVRASSGELLPASDVQLGELIELERNYIRRTEQES